MIKGFNSNNKSWKQDRKNCKRRCKWIVDVDDGTSSRDEHDIAEPDIKNQVGKISY